jgi:hypothetical protein
MRILRLLIVLCCLIVHRLAAVYVVPHAALGTGFANMCIDFGCLGAILLASEGWRR